MNTDDTDIEVIYAEEPEVYGVLTGGTGDTILLDRVFGFSFSIRDAEKKDEE